MAQAPPCPYCGASSYQLQDRRWLVCKECGHEFDTDRDLCTACGHLNRAKVTTCSRCQARLRTDVVDQIIEVQARSRAQWRAERAAIAADQKRKEEESSQRRMEAFWAEDRARREAVARAAAESQQRERKLLLTVGIVSVILILCLIAAAFIVKWVAQQPSGQDDELTAAPTSHGQWGTREARRDILIIVLLLALRPFQRLEMACA